MMKIFFSHALMIIARIPQRADLKVHEKDIAATAIDHQGSERPFSAVEE
jgi:hypothetical protein